MPNILVNKTEELAIKEMDFTDLIFVVSFRGQEFTIEGQPGRVNIYLHPKGILVGYIKRGGPRSGAIWANNTCVADYLVADNGTCSVIEIKNSFLQPSTEKESDPVLFLLSKIWNKIHVG